MLLITQILIFQNNRYTWLSEKCNNKRKKYEHFQLKSWQCPFDYSKKLANLSNWVLYRSISPFYICNNQEEVTYVATSARLIIDHLKALCLYVRSEFISLMIRVGYLLMASYGMYSNFWIWILIFWKIFSAILWYRKRINVDMSCRVV